jgi:hypothetical protein
MNASSTVTRHIRGGCAAERNSFERVRNRFLCACNRWHA